MKEGHIFAKDENRQFIEKREIMRYQTCGIHQLYFLPIEREGLWGRIMVPVIAKFRWSTDPDHIVQVPNYTYKN